MTPVRLSIVAFTFLAMTMPPCLAQTSSPADAAAGEATSTPAAPDATNAGDATTKQQNLPAEAPPDTAITEPGTADTKAGIEKNTDAQPGADSSAPANADADASNTNTEAATPSTVQSAPGSAPTQPDSGNAKATEADTGNEIEGNAKSSASPDEPAEQAETSTQPIAQPAEAHADENPADQAARKSANDRSADDTSSAEPEQRGGEQPTNAATAIESPATTRDASENEPPTTLDAPPQPSPQQAVEKPAAAPEKLSVATGSGAFSQAYQRVVLMPFAKNTGIEVDAATTDQGRPGDVVMLDAASLADRCGKDELLSLDIAELQPNAPPPGAADDFLDGALKPCGIAAMSWSNLFVYDPGSFKKRAPSTVSDVFDTRRYQGKRALPADGHGLFEALMVAEGVSPDSVYATLETGDGLMRALQRLKALGNDIVWYDSPSKAIHLIRSGDATIALTSNGHAFIEQARTGPLGLIWDGQSLHLSYFAIPKTASDKERAKQFVAFASGPQQLAALARQIPYGPTRRSAIAGTVGMRHAVTGQDLEPFLPTAPQNLREAVRFDPVWWKQNSARMTAAIDIVRHGPPLPTRR
ncbi:MAG: extracellular solute-binding protein [Hyphomicrobiaceae bacterium]|nr:extracellular solute-binding protein [Hyphomicrobiaceae bacterium]MCC0009599.1 extracellular solute-binding protein [Hyphomicrobiaceae bacterium]